MFEVDSYNERLLFEAKKIINEKFDFSFDELLASNLFLLRQAVLNQDFDACILIDGSEGSGKSVLGGQIGKFLDVDNEIDISQFCFKPDDFKNAILKVFKGKAIIWDEARRGANRRRSMNSVNLEITDLLAECRQKNLFLIVIMPSFYDMDMNVAVWRSRALVHVWYDWDVSNINKPLVRGFFRFYNERGKKALYTNTFYRRSYLYPYIKGCCFDGCFVNKYVVDESEYRGLKLKNMLTGVISDSVVNNDVGVVDDDVDDDVDDNIVITNLKPKIKVYPAVNKNI